MGSPSLEAGAPRRAVGADVGDQLVVDVVARAADAALGHGLQGAALVHAAQLLVAEVGAGGLDGMDGALGQVQRHRPVVGDGVDHVREAGVHGRLGRPDVRADVGDVLGDVAEDRHHELGVLLVEGIVGELAEALGVERLPVEPVEQAVPLAPARTHGVELVLVGDDLRAGGLGEGVEVEPVGGVAHGMGGAGHGHRDAVVAEAHADVADHHRRPVRPLDRAEREGGRGLCPGVGMEVEGLGRPLHDEVAHAERLADHGQPHGAEVVDRIGVVAEPPGVVLLRLAGLLVGPLVDGVAEDAPRPVDPLAHGRSPSRGNAGLRSLVIVILSR
jgi:hypothetical protein